MLSRGLPLTLSRPVRLFSTLKVFDFKTITTQLKPSAQINAAIESCFGKLAKGEVDVPLPMHIGIHETAEAGPGDCHIKGVC